MRAFFKNIMNQSNKSNNIVVIINTSSTSLVKVSPKSLDDKKTVANELLKGNALVVNVSNMESNEAVRFTDFLTGVVYTSKGKFKKVGKKTYLLAPSESILNKYIDQF